MPKYVNKAKKLVCANCAGKDFFEVNSSCKDASTLTYKGKFKDGYLPRLSGVSSFEDVEIKVCVKCGCLHGFDKKQIVKDLVAAFTNDSDDDDVEVVLVED